MKKSIWLLASIVCLALVLLAGCGKNSGQDTGEPAYITESDQKELTEDGFSYSTTYVEYLQFDDSAYDELNEDLRTTLKDMAADIQEEHVALHGAAPETSFYQEYVCSLAYFDDDCLSIVIDSYASTSDNAHPQLARYGIVYDRDSGKKMSLKAFFGSDAESYVADQILRQIEEDETSATFYPDYAEYIDSGLAGNKWYIAEEGIKIIYNPYEIAAYAVGIIEFTIPLEK